MEHPKAQKTGPQLKVSSDRLGEARNRTCHPWFTRQRLLPYTTAEGRLFQQLTSLASFRNLRNLCWSLTKANIFGCIFINCIISMCSFCLFFADVVEFLFLHSICWTFLTISIVRRKVCECRGRASILVTKSFAIRIYALCFIPIFVMSLVSILYVNKGIWGESNETFTNASSINITSKTVFTEDSLELRICNLLLINVLPLLLGCSLYVRLLYVVRHIAHTMDNVIRQRNYNPSKLITTSVLVLFSSTVLVWLVYIVCSVVDLLHQFSPYFFMYLKMLIFLLYPIGEGLLLSSHKSNKSSRTQLITRCKTQVSPGYNEPSGVDDLEHPGMTGVAGVTVCDSDLDSNDIPCQSSTSSVREFMKNVSALRPKGKTFSIKSSTVSSPTTSKEYLTRRRLSSKPYSVKSSNLSMTEVSHTSGAAMTSQRPRLDFISPFVGDSAEEDETVDCDPARFSALFHRRGSALVDCDTMAKHKPNIRKVRKRHTYEQLKRKRSYRKSSEYKASSLKRSSELPPFESLAETFSNSIFTKVRESPDQMPSTLEGYSGLKYANGEDTDDPNEDDIVSEELPAPNQRASSPANMWHKAFASVRKVRRGRLRSNDKENRIHSLREYPQETLPDIKPHAPLKHQSSYSRFKQEGISILPPIRSPAGASNIRARSISCVNNVSMGSSDIKISKPKTRNKSVSFISRVSVHKIDELSETRSIERGARINFKIKKEALKDSEAMEGKSSGINKIRRKTSHWMLDKSTPRQECIEKLQEMKEYF